jgi:D-psicose/D-tagatose/L-ribulose 3-epimerase
MKLGISGFAWTARFQESHLDLLPFVKELGLEALEVPMFDPAVLPIGRIRDAFERQRLECTSCAILPRHINPISPDASVRRQAIHHLNACVKAAAQMGCRLLGGPLFAPIGYLPEHRRNHLEWNWAVEAFRSLSDVLDACDMSLAIEPVNRAETFFLRSGAEAKRLCEEIANPRIGITIDTFHANIEELDIAQTIRMLGPHLKHIHISENDRGPLGRGHIPFADILSALDAERYNGYLMIEGFGYDPAEEHAPGYLWASADVTPQRFVTESCNYLRQILRSVI